MTETLGTGRLQAHRRRCHFAGTCRFDGSALSRWR